MSEHEPDSDERWALPEQAQPPLIGELVERIDEALATARASEVAVMTVGAAALDAAEQAKRAAELAERASAAMARSTPASVARSAGGGRPGLFDGPPPVPARDAMDSFNARADSVSERLHRVRRRDG